MSCKPKSLRAADGVELITRWAKNRRPALRLLDGGMPMNPNPMSAQDQGAFNGLKDTPVAAPTAPMADTTGGADRQKRVGGAMMLGAGNFNMPMPTIGMNKGGEYENGMGGLVPGSARGDKYPAKYEGGEFVVSNDMLDAQPELRQHLRGLREAVLAEKGMTPEQADAKALGYGDETPQRQHSDRRGSAGEETSNGPRNSGGKQGLRSSGPADLGSQDISAGNGGVRGPRLDGGHPGLTLRAANAFESAPTNPRFGGYPLSDRGIFAAEEIRARAEQQRALTAQQAAARAPVYAADAAAKAATEAQAVKDALNKASPAGAPPAQTAPATPTTAPAPAPPAAAAPKPNPGLWQGAKNAAGGMVEAVKAPFGKGSYFESTNAALRNAAGPISVTAGLVPEQMKVAEVVRQKGVGPEYAEQQAGGLGKWAAGTAGALAAGTAAIPTAPFTYGLGPLAAAAAGGYAGYTGAENAIKFGQLLSGREDVRSPHEKLVVANAQQANQATNTVANPNQTAATSQRTNLRLNDRDQLSPQQDPRLLNANTSRPELGASRDFTNELSGRPGGRMPGLPADLREGVVHKTVDARGRVTYSGRNVGQRADGSTQMVDGMGRDLTMKGSFDVAAPGNIGLTTNGAAYTPVSEKPEERAAQLAAGKAQTAAALRNPDGSTWGANDNAVMAANLRDGADPYRGTSRAPKADAFDMNQPMSRHKRAAMVQMQTNAATNANQLQMERENRASAEKVARIPMEYAQYQRDSVARLLRGGADGKGNGPTNFDGAIKTAMLNGLPTEELEKARTNANNSRAAGQADESAREKAMTSPFEGKFMDTVGDKQVEDTWAKGHATDLLRNLTAGKNLSPDAISPYVNQVIARMKVVRAMREGDRRYNSSLPNTLGRNDRALTTDIPDSAVDPETVDWWDGLTTGHGVKAGDLRFGGRDISADTDSDAKQYLLDIAADRRKNSPLRK